uniref:Uncharacterized protein n=1 Tax=Ananas comosus var. bracteatus TaxID=296719 RepID=A0A6V7NQ12_ANACO|nr:unnamed protein product [Ananas comosus var. bracteatus]
MSQAGTGPSSARDQLHQQPHSLRLMGPLIHSTNSRSWTKCNPRTSRIHTVTAEDVLVHKRLLEEVRDPSNQSVFFVRVVQVNDSGNPSQGDEGERGGADGYEEGARCEVGSGTGITIPIVISITSPLLMGLG